MGNDNTASLFPVFGPLSTRSPRRNVFIRVSPTQVLSKEQSVELFSEYPEAQSTICRNLLFDLDLDEEGQPIPGVEENLSDRDKIDTKARILTAMKERLEQRFSDLCQASRTGDATTVILLARQGANLNQADYNGRTAMHLACQEGNHKVVEVLLQKDADKNVKDNWGQVRYDHCVKLLSARASACFGFASPSRLIVNVSRIETHYSNESIFPLTPHIPCPCICCT